jgi:hypothetical protein
MEIQKYRNNAGQTKFTFSQGIECGIVRSNFSPFDLNILLVGVPKRNDVTGEWRKLLHNLYLSPWHVARMGHIDIYAYTYQYSLSIHIDVSIDTYRY